MRRPPGRWLLATLAAALLAWIVVIALGTGGIDRGFDRNAGYAWARDLPGTTCTAQAIPVTLDAGDRRTYRLVGELCHPGRQPPRTLQVLVSGAGYGVAYWDFPYRPDTYSYARAALRAGDAVFNFDRLGMGRSDHPPALALDVDTQARVLQQALAFLAARHDFGAVVTLGHSFGSTVVLAHALAWPEQVDGVVLTGFLHNFNPAFGQAMGRTVGVAAFGGPLALRLADPTYLISTPGSRGPVFYTAANAEPAVVATDDATRETTALGEVLSMRRYFGDQSTALAVPVLVVAGEDDAVVCGAALDCRDHAAVAAHENAFYPAAACPETRVVADTGHNLNLHRNAPETFGAVLDWIARRVGSGGAAATAPCGVSSPR